MPFDRDKFQKVYDIAQGISNINQVMDEKQYLDLLLFKLLNPDNFRQVVLTSDWAKRVPAQAGVYVFMHGENLVYVGVTGSLRGRMNDLLDSRHHTVRRTIGVRFFSKVEGFAKASITAKFPEHIEMLVNNHITENLRVAYLPVSLGRKELEEILGKTLGVPLFQEQAMKIAIVAAGFTPAEADELRRSMATFKMHGMVTRFEKTLVEGMTSRGYTEEFARRVFKQLEGFGSYGFPESHAASFALLVYVSCWLKCYYPDVFACAILNSMPMGFYQPAQLVIDARNHGVEVREIDVNVSQWDNFLQEKAGKYCALRLGFRQISGIREDDVEALVLSRGTGYKNLHSLLDVGVSLSALERLADADAFRSMGMDRRQALWEVSALKDRTIGVFEGQPSESEKEQQVELPLMSKGEHVVQDYASTALSLKAHPVSLVREKLKMFNVKSSEDIKPISSGSLIKVAGLIIVRQRPGTAGGVCFISIEDEFGWFNLVIFEKFFETYRKQILHSRLLMVEGKVQKEGEVVNVIVSKCFDFTGLLKGLNAKNDEQLPILTLSRSDEKDPPYPAENKRSQVRTATSHEIFDGGRNFK